MTSQRPKSGVFLSLDGIDGAGKSTQLKLLDQWLNERGFSVVRCRDPGGTPAGEEIRTLLLSTASELSPLSEMLLYMASRAQLVGEVIRPALDAGHVVLCDRFILSTLVYQGFAGGVDPEQIRRVGQVATAGILPDWVGVLDLPLAQAAGRRVAAADRIEGRPLDFHEKVRAGFLAEAKRNPERICVIDGSADAQTVHQQITSEVARVLAAAGRS